MEKKRGYLVEALARKARAYSDMDTPEAAVSFDSTLKSLKKWADIDSDKKFAVLTIEQEKRAGRPGCALKLLDTLIKNKGEDTKGGICPLSHADLLKKRAQMFQELGYESMLEHDKTWRVIANPKAFALF
jgi:hypothetical protein